MIVLLLVFTIIIHRVWVVDDVVFVYAEIGTSLGSLQLNLIRDGHKMEEVDRGCYRNPILDEIL